MIQFLHDIGNIPSIKTLFTIESPLDWVGIGFFILILWVIIFGSLSFVFNQLKYNFYAIRNRSPSRLKVSPYLQSILNGSAAGLMILKNSSDSAQKQFWITEICRSLSTDKSP